jgi:hypothetical protein
MNTNPTTACKVLGFLLRSISFSSAARKENWLKGRMHNSPREANRENRSLLKPHACAWPHRAERRLVKPSQKANRLVGPWVFLLNVFSLLFLSSLALAGGAKEIKP